MTTHSAYWGKRRADEQEFIKSEMQGDNDFNKIVQQSYDNVLKNIEQDIAKEYASLARRDKKTAGSETGISVDLAKARVNNFDVEEYEDKAKAIVDKAQKAMKKGYKGTYNDLPETVKHKLRVYNATMRINRLEYLKSNIGLYLTESGVDITEQLGDKLGNDYVNEVKRQAGILGKTVPVDLTYTSNVIKRLVPQIRSATFSDRIWNNQDQLKNRLENVMTNGFVQGHSYQKMAKNLRDAVGNSVYNTERIVRSEGAKTSYNAEMDSFDEYGYKFVIFQPMPKACSICYGYATADNGFSERGVFKRQKAPRIIEDTHPNCRCTVSAYWDDNIADEDNIRMSAKDRAEYKKQEKAFKEQEAKLNKGKIKQPKKDTQSIAKQETKKTSTQITNYKDFVSKLNKNHGLNVSNMEDVPTKYLKTIYKTIDSNFKKYPMLKNVYKIVSGIEQDTGTVARNNVRVRMNEEIKQSLQEKGISSITKSGKVFEIADSLEFNKKYLNDTISNDMFEKSKNEHWMTNATYEDAVSHEIGHGLANRMLMQRLNIQPNEMIDFYTKEKYIKQLKSQIIEKQIIKKVVKLNHFSNDDIQKYSSGYAMKDYGEMFAELFTSNTDNPLVEAFNKELKLQIKRRFKS